MLKVGFGRIDIMPREPVGLGGYGNGPHRIETQVLDPLFATCIAITDEQDKTLLLITMDLICMEDVLMAALRENITAATGIPEQYIFASATHTHYGPDVGNPGRKAVDDYIAYAAQRTVLAVQAALEDRAEASVLAGTAVTENLTFVRHYICADGTTKVSGSNPRIRHVADADPRLRLLRFCREAGKDILMMNWQAHPDCTGGGNATGISADYIGPLRACLEVTTGCHFAFFQGACGNLIPSSLILKKNVANRDYHMDHASDLAAVAMALLPELKRIQTGPISITRHMYKCPYDHSTDSQAPEARKVWEYWLETGDFDGSNKMAKALGYGSRYEARAILQRAEAPEYLPMELNAAVMGELAFTTCPCELFDTAGAYVIDNSPYPATWLIGYCNDSRGYFPNHDAFRYGCYEVDTHVLAEGSAEGMAEELVQMLGELK